MRFVALVSAALILASALVPSAAAYHEGASKAYDALFGAKPFDADFSESGTVRGRTEFRSAGGERTIELSDTMETTFTFRSKDLKMSGDPYAGPSDPNIGGEAEGTLTYTVHSRRIEFTASESGWGRSTETCAGRASGPHDVSITGRVDPKTGATVLAASIIVAGGEPRGSLDCELLDEGCGPDGCWSDTSSSTQPFSLYALPFAGQAALDVRSRRITAEVATQVDIWHPGWPMSMSELSASRVGVRFAQAPSTVAVGAPIAGSVSTSIPIAPARGDELNAGLIQCIHIGTHVERGARGSCEATGGFTLKLHPSACASLLKEGRRLIRALERLERPPADAAPAVIVHWGEAHLAHHAQAAVGAVRQYELLGCGPELGADFYAAWLPHLDFIANALNGRSDLSESAARALLSVARTQALLGRANGWASVEPSGVGTFRVTVHSPVALHAYRADGAHVGWNASKGAPDLDVEGATYEGRPGEGQTLTLPTGSWRIAFDGTGEGDVLVEVDWTTGNHSGNETFAMKAARGRTVSTNYHVGDDAAGGEGIERYSFYRGDTPATWRFADWQPDLEQVQAIIDKNAGGSTTAGGTDPGTRDATRATTDGTDAPKGGGSIPGAPLVVVLVAIVLVARLATRRR